MTAVKSEMRLAPWTLSAQTSQPTDTALSFRSLSIGKGMVPETAAWSVPAPDPTVALVQKASVFEVFQRFFPANRINLDATADSGGWKPVRHYRGSQYASD